MSDIIFKDVSLTKRAPDWKFFLNTWIWLSFSTFGGLKKYPKISGYLDRISKIWIMKKIDIQSIQVSMYPKKTDIHVSKYPCIHDIQVSTYPTIQLSKKNRYPRYPSIRISEKSGIRPSLALTLVAHSYWCGGHLQIQKLATPLRPKLKIYTKAKPEIRSRNQKP